MLELGRWQYTWKEEMDRWHIYEVKSLGLNNQFDVWDEGEWIAQNDTHYFEPGHRRSSNLREKKVHLVVHFLPLIVFRTVKGAKWLLNFISLLHFDKKG